MDYLYFGVDWCGGWGVLEVFGLVCVFGVLCCCCDNVLIYFFLGDCV